MTFPETAQKSIVSTNGQGLMAGTRIPLFVKFAIFWIGLMLVIALFADVLSPHSYSALNLRSRLSPPVGFVGSDPRFVFGTDELGRDVGARVFRAIRASLFIAFASTFISAAIGITLGFLSAHFRRWVDGFIMMLVDVQASLPFLIIAIGVIAAIGDSVILFAILLGFYGWERIARITRGLAISAKEQGYAKAVSDLGASASRVYGRHIFRNIVSTIVVAMTLNFAEVILLEASLSFLGLGVQPPDTSLGNLIGTGRNYLQVASWLVIIPSAVIIFTALSVSLIGDWLRDFLDPTLD